MFQMNKIECVFEDVPVNQEFYTARYHEMGHSVDSIRLTKVNKTSAKSFEWPLHEIHPDQPCWYFDYI